MSIFASEHTKTLELPFDPKQTVTIRHLSGRHLERAIEVNSLVAIEKFKRMGGPAFQKELQAVGDPEQRAALITQQRADPMSGYDQRMLLYQGITAWSYPKSLKREPAPAIMDAIASAKAGDLERALEQILGHIETNAFAFTIPAIDDLTDEAAEFLAREILRLSKPRLFQTEADAAEAQKKAEAPASVAG